jgi:hypothetical protein
MLVLKIQCQRYVL